MMIFSIEVFIPGFCAIIPRQQKTDKLSHNLRIVGYFPYLAVKRMQGVLHFPVYLVIKLVVQPGMPQVRFEKAVLAAHRLCGGKDRFRPFPVASCAEG